MRTVFVGVLVLMLGGAAMGEGVPENVYQGELVAYPGPWAFEIPKAHIILVSDAQILALTNPDEEVDLGIGGTPRVTTLRQLCEEAQAQGRRTLIFAFDYFFTQYREGQAGVRELTPDRPAYIEHIATISEFAQDYGIGLELSLLSPLEIGPGYMAETGESGLWMHYRKGLRDPDTGAYSVQLWRQTQWANNKGVVPIEAAGVRVFAFPERPVGGTPYRVVLPRRIVEITDTAAVEVFEGTQHARGDYQAVRIRVHGTGGEAPGCNRVLVVQQYRVPEMDYFSETASPYLEGLVDRYADAGVKLHGLYSDEMHIQQDWHYFGHHDHGAFALRYVSPGFQKAFAEKFGEEYADFARYLVYFCHGQEDFANDLTAKADVMHVFGDSPRDIHETMLLRSRYYRFLHDGVVDLFADAKAHAEQRMGHRLEARAHPTWAESPTIDMWETGGQPRARWQYEYTPNFVWSDTVHQAASACMDYFKWNDFLTGNGNDHAEGGWLDRNYYALALGCSVGILNDVPYAYAAHWGMPQEVRVRRRALQTAYGAAGDPWHGMVQNMQHRDAEVLMLYPLDLVAADERFGSWMTQYGYANYVTQQELIDHGRVENGAVHMAGRRFTTVCTLFEPLPDQRLLPMLDSLAEQGGRVIWSGPPPLIDREGNDVQAVWQALTGAVPESSVDLGRIAAGKRVEFEGPLEGVAPQTILTHYLPDRFYPVTPQDGAAIAARVGEDVAGTLRMTEAGGTVAFLGFRPRDDQAQSLGYDVRTWFDVLHTLGAYPGSDNPEAVSRTGDYLACRFPNGTVSIAPHLRELEEGWPGGFVRDREEDEKIVAQLDLPPLDYTLDAFQVAGHTVSYAGRGVVSFRVDEDGALVAFAGQHADRITVDGRETVFACKPMPIIAWAPVPSECQVENGAVLRLRIHGQGTVRIPAAGLPNAMHFVAQGAKPGSRGVPVASRREGEAFVLDMTPEVTNRWLYAIPGDAS
ncbi:MAG: hypothetical protein ACLFTT_05115 [Candidatus Hydrogenedentota bacterium]